MGNSLERLVFRHARCRSGRLRRVGRGRELRVRLPPLRPGGHVRGDDPPKGILRTPRGGGFRGGVEQRAVRFRFRLRRDVRRVFGV